MSPNGDQIAAPGREALERLADTELAMSPFQHPRWIHAFLAGFGEARFRLLDLVIGDTCLLLPVMIRQSGFFALADIVGG